ncbi:MAG TPA: glycosyltransferase [Candidatus Paceibacterota bacterium]|nr:glycosyltransferase [Candidatus Paceibacterota bacterium]
MKVLSIGTDRLIFDKNSNVRQRLIEYGGLFDELHVIVFAKKKLDYQQEQIAKNVFVYPTSSSNKLGYIFDALKIGERLIDNNSDWMITCQDPFETGLVGWWLKKRSKVKLQLQVHTDLMSPFFVRESLKNRIRVVMAKYLLPRADKIRVVSERIKNSLKVLKLKSEPIVLPIFVEVEKETAIKIDLHDKYPQFDFIILMASRLTREKNFPLALEAFLLARDKSEKKIGLVIVGAGPEKGGIERRIKDLGLTESVILETWTENLASYYQTADLFLLTSNYEGYGRTLVEAGLLGCPILTTNIGLVGEIVNNDNALICPVGGKDCLIEKLVWAVVNPRELEILGKKLENDTGGGLLNKTDYLDSYRQAIVN